MPANATKDTFLNGRLQIAQQSDGYRFSIDAVLLAAAIRPKKGESLIDLGTGCAIIPLILGYRFPHIRIQAVELQAELAEIASANVFANHMQDRITIINEDMRQLKAERFGALCDWGICNPPFYPAGSGRINPNDQKALARHEIHLNLTELLKSVRRLVRTGGRFATIYPAERSVALLSQMSDMGIEPKWLRTVHSRYGEPAKLVLVRGIMAGKPGLAVESPLFVYKPDGSYTDEVQAMMEP